MYGATLRGETTRFRLWAPNAQSVTLQIQGKGSFSMPPTGGGVFSAEISAKAGDRYFYQLDDSKPLPDPVSRLLPQGVHGPTEIVDPNAFSWTDQNWRGRPFSEYVIYELHVGTFSLSGTFDGVCERLAYLKDLGITAIEIMPVAAFPGERNWGYDGVSLYAVQASYGGPEGLKRLVDAAHQIGLAVILDVVYNHLGNEGNYLACFGPYFTSKHKTPWGDAINYDDTHCEHVRRFVVENALYWVREYHLDGLRLDAIQTIRDDSPQHIVSDLQRAVQDFAQRSGRTICIVSESDENDAQLVRAQSSGGYGLHGFWSDDFHHSVHAFLTGERSGYYQDFGSPEQIVCALADGYVFQGEFFKFWGEPRGTSARDVPLNANIICIQNHDQVGNRAQGERLGDLVSRGAQKAAAALMLLAPHTPMIFMGEEYGETSPFQFFTDYGDPALQKAVAEGRRKEFEEFNWDEVPDPQAPETFERSKLHWELATQDNELLQWYRMLLQIRRKYIVTGERTASAELIDHVIRLAIPKTNPRVLVSVSLSKNHAEVSAPGKSLLRSAEDGYVVSVNLLRALDTETEERRVTAVLKES
jgi:maltooligosyltrehalose trehalohydrolase